ncbi:MAG TPA: rhodanese-like domain-containing protein [Bdellovibrio sp.]|uniref:sulfurtransferase n=1 Tax=Bdellovibrio sp. TaxID=28201 RepID=UPI002EF0089D
MRFIIFLLLIAGLFTACQEKATKVTAQEPIISSNLSAEKIMADNPVILDVRSPFEYNLAHVPGSINVRWEDFSEQSPEYRGLLLSDLWNVARRLSLIGIDPDTKVVVLGKGRQGNGEEGRIAWTLQVLGVRNVITTVHTSYRELNPKEESEGIKNKPYWKPVVDESLRIGLDDFKAYAFQELPEMKSMSRARSKALGGLPPGALDAPVASLFGMNFNDAKGKVVIVDVRGPQEFAINNLTKIKGVKAPVVNIEWREFFNDKGLPNKEVEKILAAKGVTKDKIVMTISNHGVRSASAVYALRSMGFRQSLNYAGGYEQWK